MPIIKNKLNQRLIIYFKDGKIIEHLAKGMTEITPEDVESEREILIYGE